MNNVILQRIIITAASFIILGLALGIGLCKFCPGFLDWVMGGIL